MANDPLRHPSSRREFLALTAAATVLHPLVGLPAASDDPAARFADLEAGAGGRLGVCVYDANGQRTIGHRMDERFGLCSTFKLLLAGMILREIDAGSLRADQLVPFSEDDLVPYAPVTERNLERGAMTVLELAEAAQRQSDNVAANLLLELLGGPAGFTGKLRGLGDAVTRLDRFEPELNLVPHGERRDTTTPRAMADSVARLLGEDLLEPASRTRLADWMVATRTGRRRLRAGLPEAWRAGDKTGTGMAPGMVNKYNDVAAVWPPSGGLFVIAAYYDAADAFPKIRDEDEAVLRNVGRIAAGWIAG